MSKNIKIANAQGFWGDSINAPNEMVKYGDIDYLTLDYLAEITISIMQKQKMKNPNLGYAKDFVDFIDTSLELIIKNKIKIITNAGGANPQACANEIKRLALKYNKTINIAVVEGDDIVSDLDSLIDNKDDFNNMDTRESFSLIKDDICSANVYIDSFSIKDALELNADIVLCGRVTDPGLALGPMLYEFNWSNDDYDKLASGTLAGHIIECGAQCTGGNHSRWYDVKSYKKMGYPIINISSSGDFYITKPKNTGGLLNKYTVIEQILYEMGNPKEYISPDVIVDFTSFDIDEEENKIFIKNVKGKIPTDTYKVSVSYNKGYKAAGQLTISGPNAFDKAEKTADIIWTRLEDLNIFFSKKNTEYLGINSCHNDIYKPNFDVSEIVLRLSVSDNSKKNVEAFTKEISPVITNGLPGTTGFSTGRPKVQSIVAYWPTLICKSKIQTKVSLL